ncbi:phosphonate ABC transporter, permease protein PhnE [Rhodospirillaceae bacterium SYSU D60014]|uniref:phosphonate ABC transporter, permease protein PhnE n=1 Tax=Virgifigura deserti TaxID=2268457 RepID=UPI000E6601ED
MTMISFARSAQARDGSRRQWSRFRYPDSLFRYAALLGAVLFIGYSIEFLGIDLARLLQMFGRIGEVLANRYYPPDVGYVLQPDYLHSVLESIQMAYLGALFGLLLAAPLAWFASYNMTPSRRVLYPMARFVIMGSRSVHEMIWTILFVTILGFGMLPGVLALTMFCIGFAGKLLAEEIEAVDMGPVDAIRASGANAVQTVMYAVWPQVKVAWTGIAIYTWDVAFRAATVVGFFGAGGMGWYLKRNVQQLENERVAAILLSIVALVIVSELVSAWARHRVAKARRPTALQGRTVAD